MQVPPLHGNSHHKPAHEEHVDVLEVVAGRVIRRENSEGREEDQGKQGGAGDGDDLRHPVYRDD